MRRLLTKVPLRLLRSRIEKTFASRTQLGVPARDGDVVEKHVALRRAADQRPLPKRLEALPRPAATRPHDEGGAFDLCPRRCLLDLLGPETQGRLPRALVKEEGAAPGAVGRRLRAL